MDFWPENQGQSSLYSKFGTVPGRNYTHNYHERHQATNYPLYYGEHQDQGRESSYWTLPGSRTGGAPQEYTNWTDQELTAPSSHFPFILNRHSQQHQDLGEYQTHEARDREWTASQRAAREYERGFLREAWQRRWEPCSPVRYNREVSAKRSDSSYRELEAWAARYSHSLPRRRRIEAELRGASQGLVENSRAPERDSRSGTDPRVAALQQVLQSANIRESGLWDRGARQQALAYYPSHTPATDTSHMLDMKEKTGYQRGMFSQPPGYIAPPPYNSPHKNSPVLQHYDTSWEQEGKRQTYWSQPTLRKQDISVDQQDHRQEEEKDFTKPDGNQKTFPELEGLKHQRQETDALQASSPTSIQETHIQHAGMLSLQQPQVFEAAQNKMMNEDASSKVIEGRKFRLSKKTGGMTIFCLVSRIAGSTETPSLPLCTLKTNIQNTGGISKGLRDSSDINQTHKLADEIDFTAATLTDQSNTSDARNLKAKQKETPTCVGSEMLEDDRSTKAETDDVSPERANKNVADSTSWRQVAQSVQHVSAKYPLWREPSFTSRAESESLSTCLKANSEEGESNVLQSQEDTAQVHPIDLEVRRLDIKKESEDNKGLLVIDTTCVVVKMELIQSPKKDHVHYFGSTPHTEHNPFDIKSTISPECVQSSSQLDQEVTTDQNAETVPLHINERPETELDSDLMDKKASGGEGEISFTFISSSSVPKRETIEERAERILGIPLHDSLITEQQPEESATSLLNSCVDNQEAEPSPIKDKNIDDAVEQIPKNTTEEEQSQNQLEVGRKEDAVCLQEKGDTKERVVNEGGEDFVGPPEQVSNMSEENDIDSQLKTDNKASPEINMAEEPLLIFTSEEDTSEQSQERNQPVENYTSSQHPSQCLSPPTELSNSSSLSLSIGCETPIPTLSLMQSSSDLTSLPYISESNTEEGPDPELTALNSTENLGPYPETPSLPHTPSQQLPSPLTLGSTDLSPSSTPHTDHSPSPSALNLIARTAEAGTEDQDENSETLQPMNSEISDVVEGLSKDTTEELVLQQQFVIGQPDDTACVKESNVAGDQQTKEADKDHTDQILEQALQISQENAVEVNILQLQLECVQAEDVVKDPTGLLAQTMSQENGPDSQTQIGVNILQQQFDNGQEEDSCLKESYMTEEEEEQQQKETDEDPTGLLAQTMSQENGPDSQTQIEVNILQQQFDNGQEEDSCLKESCMTEEQSQKETDEDPTGLLAQTMSQENGPDSQTQIEVNILQQQFDNGQEEDSCLKESCMTEEQSQKETDEDPTGLLAQTMSQENEPDSQTQIGVNILQQQFDNGQEDVSCLKESYMTEEEEEQQQKETDEDPTGLLAQTMSQENGPNSQIGINILQQQFDNGQEEDSCLKESYMTEEEEEQQQKETDEDPTGLLAQTMSQENGPDSQTQIGVNILQQQFDNGQEDVSCLKESYMTEEQSQKETDEDPTGLLEETISKQKALDSKTQIEIEVLQDIEPSPPTPSGSDCEESQPPLDVPSPVELPSPPSTTYKSDKEYVSLFCPSPLNPDAAPAAGIPETVPPSLHLDSCEESLQFSSSSSFDSPPALLPSCSTPPPQGGSGSVYPDLPLKDEPQYPKSLWDAVNRIRKHTAPDSENEEEEPSEMWDPESVGEYLGFPDVVVDMNSEKNVFDEASQQEISTEGSIEDVDVGQIQQYPCHEELSRHAEEDTLSCSSTSSHSSGDTVIVADEEELEEKPLDAGTESKSENEEDFQMTEGERCCSGEVKDETAAKEEEHDGNESIRNESSQSEGCPVEVANLTTKAVEMTETELKENEMEGFVRSEISDE